MCPILDVLDMFDNFFTIVYVLYLFSIIFTAEEDKVISKRSIN